MLVYKINVLETLKEAGYTTTRLRKEKLINESALQDFRTGKMVGSKVLDTLCRLLDMQPGNIVKYVESQPEPLTPSRSAHSPNRKHYGYEKRLLYMAISYFLCVYSDRKKHEI